MLESSYCMKGEDFVFGLLETRNTGQLNLLSFQNNKQETFFENFTGEISSETAFIRLRKLTSVT